MPESKVTREIADIIYKSYEALRLDKVKYKEALEIIRSDLKEDFKKNFSINAIRHHIYYTFDEYRKLQRKYYEKHKKREKRRAQQKQIEKLKEENPDLFELRECMKRFESGETTVSIKPDNRYIKVLSAFGKYGYSVTGKKLAKNMGVDSVKEELKILNIHGLIEHSSKIKCKMSQKGIEVFKSLKKS